MSFFLNHNFIVCVVVNMPSAITKYYRQSKRRTSSSSAKRKRTYTPSRRTVRRVAASVARRVVRARPAKTTNINYRSSYKRVYKKPRLSLMQRIKRLIDRPKQINEIRASGGEYLKANNNSCAYGSHYFLYNVDADPATLKRLVNTDGAGNPVVDTSDSFPGSATNLKHQVYKASIQYTFRNNGTTPMKLDFATFKCIDNGTSTQTISSLWEQGIEAKGITTNETTNIQLNIKDGLNALKKYWKMHTYKQVTLDPGMQYTFNIDRKKPLYYDHRAQSDESIIYHKFQTVGLLYRIQGVPSHDATTRSYVGTSACELDLVWNRSIHVATNTSTVLWKQLSTNAGLDTQAAGANVVTMDNEENKED